MTMASRACRYCHRRKPLPMIKRFLGLSALLLSSVLATGAFAGNPPDAAAEVKFSEAETVLWMTDQLKTVAAPTVLTYDFVKAGSFEEGFKDRVIFTIQKIKPAGMKAAALDFFSGERHFVIPPEESTNANPVLKVYLQGDVYEMNRLTDPDGSARERWRYFQRRIKFALTESAKVEAAEFEFDGKRYHGKTVRFQPYTNDEKRSAFEKFADKTYAITVADSLPGYLFRIETSVPDKRAPTVPLLTEVLQLTSSKPYVTLGAAQK